MEDNKPELEKDEVKESKINSLKNKMKIKVDSDAMKSKFNSTKVKIKNFLIKFLLYTVIGGIIGFIIGARMHDVGFLAGKFEKDLRGATVFLSGKCTVNGKERNPSLNEDEVKIVSISNEKIQGVVRETREFVVCKTNEVATDTLPLLKNLLTSPTSSPAIQIPVIVAEETPVFKELEKKTLIMSGSCVDLNDQALPAFVDEKVDVTEVAANDKDDKKSFQLAGIRKSDKLMIKCLSKAIKYEVASPESLVEPVKIAEKTSFIGDDLLVSGTCFPDPRAPSAVKALFYRLTNTRILVTDEVMENKKLVKLYGKATEKEFRGIDMICDRSKMPFIYKMYNPNEQQLDSGISTNDMKKPELNTSLTEKKLSDEIAPKAETEPVK